METTCRTVRFAVFEADLHTEELRKHGTRLRLPRQSFRILALLLQRPGELVRREEIREELWSGNTFVDFDHGLNAAVNRLREALGDSADAPRFIETLPGRGYRFIGSITAEHRRSSATEAEPTAAVVPEPTIPARRRALLAGLAIIAIACIGGGAYLAFWARSTPVPQGEIRSIAVLPLENLSADTEQEYFADGMTDEIITDLAKVTSMRVISRTSVMRYKHARKSLRDIGKELNVDAVVEGTVMRSQGRVRITAQLIRTSDDRHLWADQFEGDLGDVLTLQADVARAIATRIELKLAGHQPVRLAPDRRVNPEAYDAYLRGRYIFQRRTTDEGLESAVRYFNLAIQKDPNYAPAYAALADCYSLGVAFMGRPIAPREAWSKATQAANKALQLDTNLADAHVALANIRFRYDWNWPAADREYQRAIELNPSNAHAYQSYAIFLNLMGRTEEAVSAIRKAQQLDPLSPPISNVAGYTYTWSHRFDQAIQQERKTLELDPNYGMAHSDLAWCYEEKGMWEEAVSEWLKSLALGGMDPGQISVLRQAYERGGIQAFRRKWLDLLDEQLRRGKRPKYMQMARLCFKLGDKRTGFALLEQAYKERDPGLPNMQHAAIWLDGSRSDPRYLDLVRRIGLPQ